MKKNVVKLNESQLQNLIRESVKKVLMESIADQDPSDIREKAYEIYDKNRNNMNFGIAEILDPPYCALNLWLKAADENGETWKFEGYGDGKSVRGKNIKITDVTYMEFESPSGQKGVLIDKS